jgi:hypothetical protein
MKLVANTVLPDMPDVFQLTTGQFVPEDITPLNEFYFVLNKSEMKILSFLKR